MDKSKLIYILLGLIIIVLIRIVVKKRRAKKPLRFTLRKQSEQRDWKTTVYQPKQYRKPK